MGNSSQVALEPPLSRDEIDLFILSIISSSPGFDNLQPVPFVSISTSSSVSQPSDEASATNEDPSVTRKKQALAKAYTIIGIMRSRGFRPITAEEYIQEFQSLNRYDNGKPIFIWRPLGLSEDMPIIQAVESSSSSSSSIDSIGVSTTATTVAQHRYTTPPHSQINPTGAPPVGEWIIDFQRTATAKMVHDTSVPQAYPARLTEPVSIGWLLEDFVSGEDITGANRRDTTLSSSSSSART